MNLRDPGPPLSVHDIEAFEQEIDGRLPDDYKGFLLKANGGWPEPPVGFRWNGKINEVPHFNILLPAPDRGMRRALSNIRELDINGYLPITSNMNQDDICLDFSIKIGTVWFAQYSRLNDIPVAATISPMTKSFTQLLSSLFEIPVVYCRIEELGKNGARDELDQYLGEGNSLDAIGKNGHTILREAIKFGNINMIRACINSGASLSGSIYMATFNGRPDLIQLLVDAGADVNERNEFGRTPLKYVGGTALPGAEGALNRELRDLLIKLGAVK